MKPFPLTLVGILFLAAAILGASGVAAAVLPAVAGFKLSLGPINGTEAYETADSPAIVLTRYMGRYQLEPGKLKPDQCVLLKATIGAFVFRQTTSVTICPSAQGTRADVRRDLLIAP